MAIKRARSKDEMQEPVPKPERTAEQLPWSQKAREPDEWSESSHAFRHGPGADDLGHDDALA